MSGTTRVGCATFRSKPDAPLATQQALLRRGFSAVSRTLAGAHLDHMAAVELALADRTADAEARFTIQSQTIADLDRRIAQIDAAIEAHS